MGASTTASTVKKGMRVWSGVRRIWSLETMRSVVRMTRLAAIAMSMSMNCSPSSWALP